MLLLSCIGCDRSIYNVKTDLLREEKNTKVKNLAKNLNEAKARMEELKKDDPEQAKDLFKSRFFIYQWFCSSLFRGLASKTKHKYVFYI